MYLIIQLSTPSLPDLAAVRIWGNPFFLSMYISLALCCVVPEGFHTSLKPEEALIYLYDGCMVRIDVLQ